MPTRGHLDFDDGVALDAGPAIDDETQKPQHHVIALAAHGAMVARRDGDTLETSRLR